MVVVRHQERGGNRRQVDRQRERGESHACEGAGPDCGNQLGTIGHVSHREKTRDTVASMRGQASARHFGWL